MEVIRKEPVPNGYKSLTFTASIDKVDENMFRDIPSFHENVINQMARNLSDLISSRIMGGEEYIVRMTPVRIENESKNCVSVKRELVMKRLVQCKDCVHHTDEEPGMVYCEEIAGSWVSDDWFCAYGEPKEKSDGQSME